MYEVSSYNNMMVCSPYGVSVWKILKRKRHNGFDPHFTLNFTRLAVRLFLFCTGSASCKTGFEFGRWGLVSGVVQPSKV